VGYAAMAISLAIPAFADVCITAGLGFETAGFARASGEWMSRIVGRI
jgi:hypothetical protein